MRHDVVTGISRPRRRAIPVAALFACVLVLLLSAAVPAGALTTEKATARANQSNGNAIIGGQPTRLTWEGKLADGESLSSIQLDFPDGSRAEEGSSVKATVLDGLTRVETAQDVSLTDTAATITFPDTVTAGSDGLLVRIEVFSFSLPTKAGEYALTGTYTDGAGASHDLPAAPTKMTVIGLTPTETIINWLNHQEWVSAWNSVSFLRIFLNPQMAVAAIPTLLIGWLRSLGLVLVGFPLAIPIGLGVSFLRMSKVKPLQWLSGAFVNIIRGTPLFLQIYVAFFGLPSLGIKIPDYLLGILVLAVNSSAYLTEIFRAGIQSISKGQFEAAGSLGMTATQTMFFVIIPQTVRRVIPTATSEFILLYKDTALLAAVGVMEMMMFGKSLVANTGNMTPYIVAACYYLLVTMPLTRVITTFERKLAVSEGRD
ncbi:MAG: amino acid ABC transporter permease [Actinomycetes bacterium]|nr:amino acid ABC transporter permease [Actinomycetes bacterium]